MGRYLSHPPCYNDIMKIKKVARIKARINKDGLMNSASREHRVKKGKGSFQRRAKHIVNNFWLTFTGKPV